MADVLAEDVVNGMIEVAAASPDTFKKSLLVCSFILF